VALKLTHIKSQWFLRTACSLLFSVPLLVHAQRLPDDMLPNLTLIFVHTDPSTGRGSQQCGGNGRWHLPIGTWSTKFFIDTTTDWGGCSLQLGIQDPHEHFGPKAGPWWILRVAETNPNPNKSGQCGQELPATSVPMGYTHDSNWFGTLPLTFDTDDNRRGPCQITFSIETNSPRAPVVRLEVEFTSQFDDDTEQCKKSWTGASDLVEPGRPKSIFVNTDDLHPGGCFLRLRLF
jgi:hypothetical protein